MLNPNNIKGKTFDTEKNGYSKEDVKEFLGQVAEDYAEVVKANQDTEAKIIKLVEKINEYREDEEAIQQALVVAQKESNKILTEAKTQAHDMIESAKTEQVRLAEQSASECERIVKEHKEKCAELIRTNTEITEKKINEVRAAYDEELAKFENLKAEVTQFKADLTQLYNKQIRLIMEIPASEPAEDTAEEYEEEETVEETQERSRQRKQLSRRKLLRLNLHLLLTVSTLRRYLTLVLSTLLYQRQLLLSLNLEKIINIKALFSAEPYCS